VRETLIPFPNTAVKLHFVQELVQCESLCEARILANLRILGLKKYVLGEVFKPEDLVQVRRRRIDAAVRDLSPGVRETTKAILHSRRSGESKKKLVRLLGEEEATRLLKNVTL